MRKAGLPKRLPFVSSAGHSLIKSSAVSSTSRIDLTVELRDSFSLEMAEMGVSWTESARVKTKERMSEYVGEARKSSWSCGESMRRLG